MDDKFKIEINEQIDTLLDDLRSTVKDGSRMLVEYAARRRQHIADAVAARDPNLHDLVRIELLNIQAYAATEAVKSADKYDQTVIGVILNTFAAFDTLLLAALK